MLHGLGDSGDGWAPVGAEWAPDLKYCKFIFPHAPNVSESCCTFGLSTRTQPRSGRQVVCVSYQSGRMYAATHGEYS
jgi:hypothetical protein